MKRLSVLLLIVFLCSQAVLAQHDQQCPPSQQASGAQFQLVVMGMVQAVSAGGLQIMTQTGQTGNVQPSPSAIYHDASQPVTATSSFSQIRQGDGIMVLTDQANKTHILFLHQGQQMDQSWQGTLAPTSGQQYPQTQQQQYPQTQQTQYPQYPETQQYPQTQQQQYPQTQQQYPQQPASSVKFTMVMYGQVQSISGRKIVIAAQGQSATVEASTSAVYQDTSKPLYASSSFSQIRQGDELMVVTDQQGKTHILFLHPGQQMEQSWYGTLAPPSGQQQYQQQY